MTASFPLNEVADSIFGTFHFTFDSAFRFAYGNAFRFTYDYAFRFAIRSEIPFKRGPLFCMLLPSF